MFFILIEVLLRGVESLARKTANNMYIRSIPVHPTFFNDAHCDLGLMTPKINRIYSLTLVKISDKFDEEAHNGLVSIVFTSLFSCMSIVTSTFRLKNKNESSSHHG